MPERLQSAPREKGRALHLGREEKNKPQAEVATICGKNESTLLETVKENGSVLVVAPQTAKVRATACDKRRVKMVRTSSAS